MTATNERHENLNLTNPELVRDASIASVTASMRIVRDGQARVREVIAKGVIKKADATEKTVTDEESGMAAIAELQARFPRVPIVSEDAGRYGAGTHEQPREFMVDGLDGTAPFLEGKDTSTAITALYNSTTGEIEQVTIGRPSTGEIWFTEKGKTKTMTVNLETGQPTSQAVDVHVSTEELGPNTPVLIELLKGFSRKGTRQILTDQNVAALVEAINEHGRVQQQGSNGLNLAQVASGQNRVVASISTAIGGEWDVAGALAVIGTGGVAEGFRMHDDHTVTSANALAPFEYDILIAANNERTLQVLKNSLLRALSA